MRIAEAARVVKISGLRPSILEQRQRFRRQEPGVLHVPRAGDMLELELPPADLSIYEGGEK
jgi:hypothetical protein